MYWLMHSHQTGDHHIHRRNAWDGEVDADDPAAEHASHYARSSGGRAANPTSHGLAATKHGLQVLRLPPLALPAACRSPAEGPHSRLLGRSLGGLVAHAQVERLVRHEAAEQQVGVVVELVVGLVVVEAEQHLAHHVHIGDDPQHRLDEDAEHVRVEPRGDARDIFVRAPVEHHHRERRVELDLEHLAQGEGLRHDLLERGGGIGKLDGRLGGGRKPSLLQEEAEPRADFRERELRKPAVRDDRANDQRLPVRKGCARAAACRERRHVCRGAARDEAELLEPVESHSPVVAQRADGRVPVALQTLALAYRLGDFVEGLAVRVLKGAHLGLELLAGLGIEGDPRAELGRLATHLGLELGVALRGGQYLGGGAALGLGLRGTEVDFLGEGVGAAAQLVLQQGLLEDVGAVASVEVAEDKGAVDRELRGGGGHLADEHLAQLVPARQVAQPGHRERGRVDHVPEHVHAAAAGTAGHLPELVGP
mmetsp:Transcript_8085/g.17731  ORF Transcript_8085/g.17731 Transcript_8085/m.17731 type:complete len:480 (-) Transcript_8085:160-1599(-)